MLTTFNEADMTAIMALRERRKESFKKEFGVSLGISSFFVKASIAALRAFPALNAEIQGDEIVYKHYFDIGRAVGAEGGLVVPVLRDADRMNFPQIEQAIRDFAKKAQDGTLTLETKIGCSKLANSQGPTKVGLPVGATITVEAALQALIMKSANDVAVMLAEAVSGSHEAFVDYMNGTAARLGMTRTKFANANGLPAPEQVTTARDMA